jgi:hypothetical protein
MKRVIVIRFTFLDDEEEADYRDVCAEQVVEDLFGRELEVVSDSNPPKMTPIEGTDHYEEAW